MENIPGILLEFLSGLTPKQAPGTKLAFLIQGGFEKAAADAFAGPEYMPEKQIRMYNRVGKHISRFFMGHIARKLGCKGRLDARPYERATRMRK